MSKVGGFTAAAPASPTAPRSPWHSPVPYLFGGLAAMLGLIAFALLILACSYWRLSGYLENNGNNDNDDDRDLEAGGDGNGDNPAKAAAAAPVLEEKVLVIMAGQEKPTFLATPVPSRASSFGSNSSCCCSTQSSESSTTEKSEHEDEENLEKHHLEMGNMVGH